MTEPTTIVVSPPADGAVNFARDDVLLARARATGRQLVRVYSWLVPVVSFGRHERAARRYSEALLRGAGVHAARRITGGRALYHWREITYAVAAPIGEGASLRASYGSVNAMLVAALARCGVHARVAEPDAPRAASHASRDGAPCFSEPLAGELTVNGRKLVASAQWREAGAFLQHGSVLIDDDQPSLAALYADGVASVPPVAAATLRELIGRSVTANEFADALDGALRDVTGVAPVRESSDALLPDQEVRARAERYRDPSWTWRR